MPNPNMGTAGLYTYNPSHVAYMASQTKDPKAYGVTPGETWKPYLGTAGMYNYSPSHVAYMASQSKNPESYGVKNEHRVVNVNGQQVRMGPNSSIFRTEPANPWKNFMDTMKGYTKPNVSNVAGVRG